MEHEGRHHCVICRWLWPLLVIAVVCIASGNAIEAPFLPPTPLAPDKVAHLAVFGLLATLIYRALPQGGMGSAAKGHSQPETGRNANWRTCAAIGITALFGIGDEIHQSFNPARTFELYDFVADALGAVVAVCAYRWLPFYRKALELRLVPRSRKKQ